MKYIDPFKIFILWSLLNKGPKEVFLPALAYKDARWKNVFSYLISDSLKDIEFIFNIDKKFIEKRAEVGVLAEASNDYLGVGRIHYERIEKGEIFNVQEIKSIIDDHNNKYVNFIFANIKISFSLTKAVETELKGILNTYVNDYIKNRLEPERDGLLINQVNYFNLRKSSADFHKYIENHVSLYTTSNIKVNTKDISDNIKPYQTEEECAAYDRSYRFLELLLAYEKIKYIKIHDIHNDGTAVINWIGSTIKVEKSDNKTIEKKELSISSITFVKPKGLNPTYKYIVNDDWTKVKTVGITSKRLKTLVQIAEGNPIEYNKEIFDYINFNKVCPLYFKGKYSLTKILEREGKYMVFSPQIKHRLISHKSYMKKSMKNT